jgi:peptidoglycan/LPS O-acetylase OafA/YrhL
MKYRNLDILRALAVLYVFLNHITLEVFRSPGLVHISGAFGRFGVILFFIHTSLVLMQSMDSLARKSARWPVQFYTRRVFRIYPLAIVAVFLALVLHTPTAPWDGPQTAGLNAKGILLNVLLLQNIVQVPPAIGPLWTLPIEVQMYVVLPLVFLAIRSRNWTRIMIGLWVASAAVAGLVFHLTGKMNLLAFTPCFLCGAIAYKLRSTTIPGWSSSLWVPAIFAATLGGIVWTLQVPLEWAMCLGLALLFPHIREVGDGWFSKTCHLVAKYSYCIYLSNLFACWVAFQLLNLGNVALQILVAAAITTVASVASYHLIEDPLIQAGKRVSDHLAPARAPRLATAGPGAPYELSAPE